MIPSLKSAFHFDRIRSGLDFLEHHPLPTFVVDPEDFRIIMANEAAVAGYGYPSGDLLLHNFLDFFSEESRILFFNRATHEDTRGFNALYHLFTRNGDLRSVSLYASSITFEGQRLYQFSTVDLTENTALLESLEAEKLRYKTYIEQSSEGIFCQEFNIPMRADLPAEQLIEYARKHSFISECNDAMARMYGYERAEELTGIFTGQVLDHEDQNNLAYLTAFIRNGFKIINAESKEKDRFGNTRYFLNSAIGILENGYLKRVWGTQQDITSRKKTEDELRLLANLVQQTSDVLTAADMDFRPITWNQAAERVYGVSAEQAIGSDIRSYLTMHYQGSSREQVRATLDKEGEWRGEAFFIRPTDKKLVTLLISFKRLNDGTERPLGYLVSATDITERKEAEFRLRESENRFRDMADSAPVMIWMSDENNQTTYLNRKWIEFTGNDMAGSPEGWCAYVFAEDLSQAKEQFDNAFKERSKATLFYRLLCKDGAYRWVQDVSVPRFLNDGTFVGYIGTVVDIEDEKQKQEQLRYQATILENVSDIVVTTDLDFIIMEWNKTAEKYYERSAEEAIGRKAGELLQFNYAHTNMEEAFRELLDKGFWEGEVSRVNKAGETLYFLHTVKYLHDVHGSHIGYLAVGRDITERKKIEEQLLKSEQFYRTLIADSLDGMLLVNEEGNISFASPSVRHVVGYNAEELMGKNIFSYVHPDDIAAAIDSFQKEIIESPVVKFVTVRVKNKSGEWTWCTVRGHNLLKNPNIKSLVVYFHDDSLRKQANDALKESEARFRHLVKDLQTGVLLQDSEGNILMSNNAMFTMFGAREEDLLGRQIWNLYSDTIKEDGSKFELEERPIYQAMYTKKMIKDVVMGVWHPGRKEHIWLILCADPILDNKGNLTHVVCSFTDITERKKMDLKILNDGINHQKELTQATIDGQENERREIGKELHDNIGQQLTTIKLFLDMAKTTADDNTNEMVSMALKGVSDVINEVRAMSRSLVPYTLKDLGLVESIEELVESIRVTQLLQIRFRLVDFDDHLLPDNQQLTVFRIVQEQLNNIVKHAGAKKVSIELASIKNMVILKIKDDGAGFDLKKVRKGLGFMNIRNRVELFGGTTTIVSEPGKGCLLTVSFPHSRIVA